MQISLSSLSSLLPRVFLCSGCNLPTRDTVCDSCLESRKWNSVLLPSSVHEVEGIAPLLISYENTQRIINRWKETGGSDLRRSLFGISSGLKNLLLEQHFMGVIPIPQSPNRSFRRGQESALEVAKFFARELELPLMPILELKETLTARQASRSRFDRAFSENPFRLSYDYPWNHAIWNELESRVFQGREIKLLIVDDLITTGTTLGQAATTVKMLLPRSICVAGALGFRPKRIAQSESLKSQIVTSKVTPPAEWK